MLSNSTRCTTGFVDPLLSQAYSPAAYPDHGSGLFVVGVEGTGALHLLALDHASGAAQIVATLDSGHPNVMASSSTVRRVCCGLAVMTAAGTKRQC